MASALIATCAIPLHAASWNIQKIDGRDVVPFDQVAGFYQLGAVRKESDKIASVGDSNRSIKLKVNSREAIINGVRHWFAFPVREQDGLFWISRMDVTKSIDPIYRPAGINGLRPFDTVVLDAGHGGRDNGAPSPLGVEKKFTLDLAKRVKSRLEQAGLRVVMTRNSDIFIPLESRPAVAAKYPRSIFVSLHFNDANWRPAASGMEIFCLPSQGTAPTGQEKPLARDMEKLPGQTQEGQNIALANTIFSAMRGKFNSEDRGVKRARFKVLQLSKSPAVLIEAGFLTNPGEAKDIASPKWRDRMADAITSGILEYRKVATSKSPPRSAKEWGGKPTTEFITD